MSGILVGVDGSGHSQRALEWAAKEAALRNTSLTVLTVHQAVAGFWGGALHYQGDEALVQTVAEAAKAQTIRWWPASIRSLPRSTSRRSRASRPRKSSMPEPMPTSSCWVRAAAADSPACCSDRSAARSPSTPKSRSSSCPRRSTSSSHTGKQLSWRSPPEGNEPGLPRASGVVVKVQFHDVAPRVSPPAPGFRRQRP